MKKIATGIMVLLVVLAANMAIADEGGLRIILAFDKVTESYYYFIGDPSVKSNDGTNILRKVENYSDPIYWQYDGKTVVTMTVTPVWTPPKGIVPPYQVTYDLDGRVVSTARVEKIYGKYDRERDHQEIVVRFRD